MTIQVKSHVGETIICAETGKTFIGAINGCTTNYATDSAGNLFSDEGVDQREKRELLDRSKPFFGYISSDGKHFTGWKGNVLGRVTWSKPVGARRSVASSYNVTDIHGGKWYGRGSGAGMCINLRPCKG